MAREKKQLERRRIDRLSTSMIVGELEKVAKHFDYRKFTRHEFDSVSKECKGSVVLSRFGSWENALSQIGKELKPHRNPRRDKIPKALLLAELGRIWHELGHRPSKTEWEASDAKYSYTTYKTRFGGWLNACGEYVEATPAGDVPHAEFEYADTPDERISPLTIPQEKKRNIPLKLRLKVFQRDSFRCTYCGRSPATNHDVTLHVDHIKAFSEGGNTTLENLQTLCNECNWGKGTD